MIEAIVLRNLERNASYSGAELLAAVRQHAKVSKQALYKCLRNLIQKEVVIKTGKQYLFNFQWLEKQRDHYSNLVEKQRELLLKPLINSRGQKLTFKLTSLIETVDLWIQIMRLLIRNHSIIYEWHPYLWFVLLKPSEESKLLQQLKKNSVSIKAVVSPHSKINNELLKIWKQSEVVTIARNSPFKNNIRVHYTVIDEYLISIHLSNNLERDILNLYRNYKNPDNLRNLIDSFNARGNIRITLECATTKHEKIARLFENTFAE